MADEVLELRVHGVNNTTPAALLDLPDDGVRTVAGDKLGSFWEGTPEALDAAAKGKRGAVPAGIHREAYSWGGMVRTTPNFGGGGTAGKVVGVLARVFYAIVLPFAIGNAVQWSRRLTVIPQDKAGFDAWRRSPEGKLSRRTAGAARLFGLILTLLFTTTAATLALDIGAAQCGPTPALCGPLEGLLTPLAGWTGGQRLALLALVPVLAVILLWTVSAISHQRYDVLPGMEGNTEMLAGEDAPAQAVLAQTGFWSNRLNRYLARTHLAAAIWLTTLLLGLQTSMGWYTECERAVVSGCYGRGPLPWPFWVSLGLAVLGLAGILVAAAIVFVLPTMQIRTEEEVKGSAVNRFSQHLLVWSGIIFGVVLLVLAIAPTPSPKGEVLYGGGIAPLVLTLAGVVLAWSGLFWRSKSDRGSDVAWSGRAPAVFMMVSLAVAVAVSSLVIVTVGDFLNGAEGPAALIGRAELGQGPGIQVPGIYVALGTLILFATVIAVAFLAARLFGARDVTARAEAWQDAPTSAPQPDGSTLPPSVAEHIVVPSGGVLPPSSASLFRRITDKRTTATRAHIMEPAVSVLTRWLAGAVVLGLLWGTWSFAAGRPLWQLPLVPAGAWPVVIDTLNLGMLSLAWLGLILVGALAAGATADGVRPLGIVWDIACYLPRTGHPFGPPCYAERAVPEIAGRLHRWLAEKESHRAILSAHSMGAVLSVSALGVLASSSSTRLRMDRIALLTFGVQLRPFFGRMLPELLGPAVLGNHTSLRPTLGSADPWTADFEAEKARQEEPSVGTPGAADRPPIGSVTGTLIPRTLQNEPSVRVPWVNLWRLSDYLGYPAFSTAPRGTGWQNVVDRYAGELDTTGYMVAVGTHGEYYRAQEYTAALEQLSKKLTGVSDVLPETRAAEAGEQPSETVAQRNSPPAPTAPARSPA